MPRIAHRMPIIHAEPRASSRPARIGGRDGAGEFMAAGRRD
jgi:hypothetical protein